MSVSFLYSFAASHLYFVDFSFMQMYREIIKALEEAGKNDSTIAVITGKFYIIPKYSTDMKYLPVFRLR